MVPKVASSGRSFKGAAAYYLHDKKANTSERVAFTEAVNLPTCDGHRAIAHMIDTAEHASQLKAAAGLKAGRKLQKPVYAYSLSWHPDQNPTKADQIEAARQSLKALGVSDRQALIVSHNDEPHPHVHVIVNRVCPETGKAAKMDNDHLKLSQWAERYERENGGILCAARVENNDKRKRGYAKDKNKVSYGQWKAWKRAETKAFWDEYRADRATLSPIRTAQYDALWRQKDERFQLRRAEIKQLYKPIWRDVFKRQKEELRQFDSGLTGRLKWVMKQPRHKVLGALSAVVGRKDLRAEFIRDQEAERRTVAQQQKSRVADATREITKAWKYDRDQLKAMHRTEDEHAFEVIKSRVTETWRQPAPQQDQQRDKSATDFDMAKDRRQPENKPRRNSLEAFFGGDKAAIEKARQTQEERRQRNLKRKRQRGRDRDDGGREREP